nr:MAG TPA: hypothetical protein [Caudoviricetes sp.]
MVAPYMCISFCSLQIFMSHKLLNFPKIYILI